MPGDGEGSHTVWLSLIFPSSGDNSTAAQHPEMKTLFSRLGITSQRDVDPNHQLHFKVSET